MKTVEKSLKISSETLKQVACLNVSLLPPQDSVRKLILHFSIAPGSGTHKRFLAEAPQGKCVSILWRKRCGFR